MGASKVTATRARVVWKPLREAVQFQDERVFVMSHAKPVAAVVAEGLWRRLALDNGLDPDDTAPVGARDSRNEMNDMLTRAKAGKASSVLFHEQKVEAVVVPWSLLGLSAQAVAE